ncbi:MAG: chaperone modulator CbpM [Usitatibacter sp.]
MADRDVIVGIALEEACLTLEQLAEACSVEAQWVVQRVDEGLLPSVGPSRPEWRFRSDELLRARRMRQVERDFEAVPELAALVADMLEELDRLRARIERGGFR